MGVAANKRAGGKSAERVRTRLRKGDTVLVTTGKERGKTGKILKILAEKNRAIVERLNMVKRHRSGQGPQAMGGIVEKEASIHLSNLRLICPKSNQPSRVSIRRLEDGTKVRWSNKFDEAFDS